MSIHCGIDMVEIQRIKDSIQRYGDNFVRRIFTDEEIKYCESRKNGRYESFAARFPVGKPFQRHWGRGRKVTLQGIEMVNDTGESPCYS